MKLRPTNNYFIKLINIQTLDSVEERMHLPGDWSLLRTEAGYRALFLRSYLNWKEAACPPVWKSINDSTLPLYQSLILEHILNVIDFDEDRCDMTNFDYAMTAV
jgi:hypothetical protein